MIPQDQLGASIPITTIHRLGASTRTTKIPQELLEAATPTTMILQGRLRVSTPTKEIQQDLLGAATPPTPTTQPILIRIFSNLFSTAYILDVVKQLVFTSDFYHGLSNMKKNIINRK